MTIAYWLENNTINGTMNMTMIKYLDMGTKAIIHSFKLPTSFEQLINTLHHPVKPTDCPLCHSTLDYPITLSCGFTLCSNCIPNTIPYQCPSFTCLRFHSDINQPTRLIQEIQSISNPDQVRPLLGCPICYSLLDNPITTQCGHTFCKSCITLAMSNHRACPICRAELNRIGRPNQAICRWLTYLHNPNSLDIKLEYIPIIELNTILFPTQSCIVRLAKPHSLFVDMVHNPDITYYALCLTRDLDTQFHDIGTMLQITHVDLHSGMCVIEASSLFRIKIEKLADHDCYYTGEITKLSEIDEGLAMAPESKPIARLKPCSMHLSSSACSPRSDLIPYSFTRRTWSPSFMVSCPTLYSDSSIIHQYSNISTDELLEQLYRLFNLATGKTLEKNNREFAVWYFAQKLPIDPKEKLQLLGYSRRERLLILIDWASI
ncbi:hypothetical protein K501DRAFT_329736 [Backusella circina FSU 941]|nr:hypothetical protein K501DRAFT_329736 [Backusella circina FSU 941]